MEELKSSYHQNDVREFISELRLRMAQYALNQNHELSIMQRIEKLEELIKKADEYEKNNRGKYPEILYKLVLEKTKCFLHFDDLIHQRKK